MTPAERLYCSTEDAIALLGCTRDHLRATMDDTAKAGVEPPWETFGGKGRSVRYTWEVARLAMWWKEVHARMLSTDEARTHIGVSRVTLRQVGWE